MLATVLLLTLLVVASFTDLRWHKIYNWTTYPGMLAAVAINAAGLLLISRDTQGRWEYWLGWIPDVSNPLAASLIGWLACGFVMLVCLVTFQIGGGDVKLIAMLGAFLGLEQGLVTMLWMLVLGGALGVIVLIWQVGLWKLLVRAGRQIARFLRLGSQAELPEEDRAVLRQPLYLAPTSIPAVLIVRFGVLEWVF
mgnify:CR=1 FL=1